MFQTEPIKFLQSFASDGLTQFFLFVTQLGYSSFYVPVLILITFGLSFRKGYLLTQTMIWVGIVTGLLKAVIALPRPADVDSGVRLLQENVANPTPFSGMGGAGFWDLPDRDTIRLLRSQPEWSFGLPSGHVSGATTFWGGLSLLFPNAAVRAVALAMIVLMPLSRMYLGRHFLADVVAGFLLAIPFLTAVHVLFLRPGNAGRLLELSRLRLQRSSRTVLLLFFLLIAPISLLALGPLVDPGDAGRLFGMNVAFLLLAARGLPNDAAPWLRRTGRVVLAFVLYWITARLVALGIEYGAANEDNRWVEFLSAAVPGFAVLWGGVLGSLWTGLYSKNAAAG